ncbi:MAG: peroxide stress protein YaaA [Methanomassiliicoccales archaeon]|nr:MAG: peroxide stress protein YaaA [Methanomassiliicoccales archaeon]
MAERNRALYLIACCAQKRPGGGPLWSKIREERKLNKFPQLNSAREELMDFYSNITEEEIDRVYKAPGGTSDRAHEKRLRAFQKNLDLETSPTMAARMRYRGFAYKKIPWMGRDSAKGDPNNVLIMSALMGLIHPDDFIPDYELMMKDSSSLTRGPSGRVKTVSRYWQVQMREFQPTFAETYPDLEYIYCFMSTTTGYVDAIRPLLSGYDSYVVDTNRRGVAKITSSWGEGVKRCAPTLVRPADVERKLEKMECELRSER